MTGMTTGHTTGTTMGDTNGHVIGTTRASAPAAQRSRPASPGTAARATLLRRRLLATAPTDRLLGWLGPLLAAALGGVIRFWDLGRIHTLIFDETYYVKQAYSMLLYGVEMRNNESFNHDNAAWNSGTFDPAQVFTSEADFVVHPPVGKWVIAGGEQLFGIDNPFGWRFSVALLGTLSILMVGRAARRMFGSTYLATCAALLLAFDGHHLVHSRTGLLDLIVMFFALGAFCALLIDRDRARDRLAGVLAGNPTAGDGLGPWLGLRPWRWVAGVSLGLCVGTKWSGLWFVAAFGLMTVLWDRQARGAVGVPRSWTGALVKDAIPAAFTMLGAGVATYLASWTGWFRSTTGYDRDWALTHPPSSWLDGLLPDALRSLWAYHEQIWTFHVSLTSSHDYMSNPWSWIVMGRPTSFYYEGPKRGEQGCLVDSCSSAITNMGTVPLWWGAALAIPVVAFCWALRRDWRAGAVLCGLAAGWLPWFLYQERTIYTFYAVAFVPWVVLAVTYVLGLVVGPVDATPSRRRRGIAWSGGYVLLCVAMLVFWWPILTAQVIPYQQWQWHMWFPSWV